MSRGNDGTITIINTTEQYITGVVDVIGLAFGYDPKTATPGDYIDEIAVQEQIHRFPEGQFVAVYRDGQREVVVGMACTMRRSSPP